MLFEILLQFDERFKKGFCPKTEIKLKPKELDLLSILGHDPGHSMRFYAEKVRLEPGSFTYLTQVLEGKGLIKRSVDQNNKRKKNIILTTYGNEIVQEIFRQMNIYCNDVMENFTTKEKKDLEFSLKTLNELLYKLPLNKRIK